MKAAALTLLAAGSAAAFAPQHALTTTTASSSSLSMSSNDNKEMSKALPFAPRPKLLDGSLPGDVGFDPFGFGGADKQSLIQMREAELKHSRLAMLAAVGWPLAELWDKSIAGVFGLEPALTSTGSSPSLLNGGLDKIEPDYWIIVAAIAETSSSLPVDVVPDQLSNNLQIEQLSPTTTIIVFLIGIIPFLWATYEFWRRIAVGASFGTGSDSVIIPSPFAEDVNDDLITIGEDNNPNSSRGRRTLDKGALTVAYVLFAVAGGSVAIALASVLMSPPPPL
ncbi:hypothetical protein ACHAWU_005069 [Discostella pseudostelligera]|uniref:Uncharacterized protein n=1 Tax=Discostella pseudostelligera TaxID=259834 RepID=A0ABD3M8H2_9STRA